MKCIKYSLMAILFVLSGQAHSASIGWGTAPASINVNDTFTLDITGSGFTSNVDGGGLNVSYDSSVLRVLSVTIDETVWDFGFGIQTGDIDNSLGTVDGISVNAWSSVTDAFTVATVEFEAIAAGDSLLSLSEWDFNPWAGDGSRLNPDFVGSTVSVSAVPLPLSVWLFGSGLTLLMGLARRKHQ